MADFSRDNKTYSSDYARLGGYEDIFNRLVNQAAGSHSDSDAARKQILTRINSAADQFKSLFKNSVGRDASDDEISKFLKENAGDTIGNANQGSGRSESDTQGVRNSIAQYIGDTFQGAAQDTATQKATDLQGKYNSLADQYLEMGKKSLGNLSDDLKTYSTSLFEKLRPQLNLAAQAGGYGDSGGQTLQEQGALKDLATQGQGQLAGATYDVENNANNIRYGGMAAPVSMASQFAANTPYAVQSLGAGGYNFNNQDAFATNNYLRQLGLMDASGRINERTFENNAPSFGRSLSQSFANNFGNVAANQLDAKDWYKASMGH